MNQIYCTVYEYHSRAYFVLAGAISSVCFPGLLVQAVRDSEECDVVVPQLCPDPLRLHFM